MPSFSKDLDEALHRALVLASERQHEFATVEHLLLALIDDPDAANEMRAREINLGSLRHDLVSFIDSELTGMVAGRHVEA
ncbi:MAG: Clp protease N-terminal domain-containing protein, partial [Alphaproteobacteria bacterium]